MDIPCKQQLSFLTVYPDGRTLEKAVAPFYPSQHEMLRGAQAGVAIKEFDTVYLRFEDPDETARLYLEGLELIPEQLVQLDENNIPYLPPGRDKCPFYLNNSDYYPVRVGTYQIRVISGGCEAFARLDVLPKHLSENEWELLKNDLENELRGLAQDLIRKNIGMGDRHLSATPVKKLYRFFVITKYAEAMIGALIDLKDRPNYRIEKKYSQVQRSRIKAIDKVTIKDYLVKGMVNEKYRVPHREITYDLPENQWLKRIIECYENELRDFQSLLESSKKDLDEEISLLQQYGEYKNSGEYKAKQALLAHYQSYNLMAERILKISGIVKKQAWYQEISPVKDGRVPHQLVMDSRYAIMYRLYQELNSNEFKIKFDPEYAYAWKLTNKLYEMWCFIKLAKMLTAPTLNFESQGWLFDHGETSLIIPILKSDTCIEFSNGRSQLKLYYDKNIPGSSAATDMENNPIYTVNSHNKPDARLDIYVDGHFMNSIIFEFKYRTINSFWNKSFATSSHNQIISYRHNTVSNYTKGLPTEVAREMRAVSEVWVLHPTGKTEQSSQLIEKSDEGIKLVRLKPNEEMDEIIAALKHSIERITGLGEKLGK